LNEEENVTSRDGINDNDTGKDVVVDFFSDFNFPLGPVEVWH
jgi:hypothetical protein